MNSSLILYHGSDKIIRKPVYGEGREHNDYGKGFYCTESPELAKEWACTSLKGGFANQYRIDISDLRILSLNNSEYSILNWIAVLTEHRVFRIRNPIAGRAKKYLKEHFYINVDAYDIIRGYRADDAYFDFADAFLNNAITVEQLSQAMQLGKLGEQVVIKSSFAFQKMVFENAFPADRNVYYPARKARNDLALTQYWQLSSMDIDGLYMADIIREKIENDDARIPRNLS